MLTAAITTCLCVSALFKVDTIPTANEEARVFFADADRDKKADLCVLDDSELTAFRTEFGGTPATIAFESGVSGFDIFDLDRDGQNEVVAVYGDAIVRYDFPESGASSTPESLFSVRTRFADKSAKPFPCVLAIVFEDQVFLGLPCEAGFELRDPDGTLVKRFPLAPASEKAVSLDRPFVARTQEHGQAGPQGAWEVRVSRIQEYHADLPEPLFPPEAPEPGRRTATLSQRRAAASLDYQNWPWFSLTTAPADPRRVRHALAAPDYVDTLVRLELPVQDAPDAKLGPPRRYRGQLVQLTNDQPDFNGDGYVDMLLWTSSRPGGSLDSLTRAATGRTWPVQLLIHLFNDKKGRYEPRAAGMVSVDVPIPWFISWGPQVPLLNCVLRDFDGDGKTDLGLSTAENEFSAWLYKDGFGQEPDFHRVFDDDLEDVDIRADIDGEGRTSLVLRGEKNVYLLRALAQ